MIDGVAVRELSSHLRGEGIEVEIWGVEDGPTPAVVSSHLVFPGVVEAWFLRGESCERFVCLSGMIKLVLCDRREGSGSEGEVMELFLGEYRLREVAVPAGVLRGWKAVGDRPALFLTGLEEGSGEAERIGEDEAAVPYDWDIVMQ